MAKNLMVGDRVRARGFNDKGTVHGIMVIGNTQEVQVGLDKGVTIYYDPDLLAKLIPKKPPREYWINVYSGCIDDRAHKTKEMADANAWEDRIECIPVREIRRKKK